MDTPHTPPESAAPDSGMPARRCNRRSRAGHIVARLLFAGALFGVVALGAYVGASHAHPSWRAHHAAFGNGVDPESAARRVDAMVGFALADVDASTEQKARIGEIARGALADLAPLRKDHQVARERALGLLSAAVIDRAALESLRQSELALADQASRRLAQALADAAEVLKPEQRERLAARMKARQARRG